MKYLLFAILSCLLFSICKGQDRIDTIKTHLLITECDTCIAKCVIGYAIKSDWKYDGSEKDESLSNMEWSILTIKYLDKTKKYFKKGTIVWMDKKY